MNEQENREDSTITKLLTDLPAKPQQAEETKGGVVGTGGGMGAGKVHVHDIA